MGRHVSYWDPMSEEVSELIYGRDMFTVDGSWSVFDYIREKVYHLRRIFVE